MLITGSRFDPVKRDKVVFFQRIGFGIHCVSS
ncbi:Uncharacterised protein [Vibrio cholerae]|nr:Uncharacterised protein [Vibrio cholerae]